MECGEKETPEWRERERKKEMSECKEKGLYGTGMERHKSVKKKYVFS